MGLRAKINDTLKDLSLPDTFSHRFHGEKDVVRATKLARHKFVHRLPVNIEQGFRLIRNLFHPTPQSPHTADISPASPEFLAQEKSELFPVEEIPQLIRNSPMNKEIRLVWPLSYLPE